MSVRNCFIRGSVVRYVQVKMHSFSLAWLPGRVKLAADHVHALQLPTGSVDVEILHDATRREARGG